MERIMAEYRAEITAAAAYLGAAFFLQCNARAHPHLHPRDDDDMKEKPRLSFLFCSEALEEETAAATGQTSANRYAFWSLWSF